MYQIRYFVLCGIISFNPHNSPLRSLPPFSWLRKLRFREIKQIDQSHKDCKWQRWDQTEAVPFQSQTLNHYSPHLLHGSLLGHSPLDLPGLPIPQPFLNLALRSGVLRPLNPAERFREIMQVDSQSQAWWLWGAPEPQVAHPNTHAGTTHRWRRPRSWLAASLCQTGCWARCRSHRHFGSWRESGMVSSVPGQPSSCPSFLSLGSQIWYPSPALPQAPPPFSKVGGNLYSSSEAICQSPKSALRPCGP